MFFPHPRKEPVDARIDHMSEKLSDGHVMGCNREGKLFRGKRCDGLDNGVLIVLPTWLVKRGQGRDLFCHSCLLLASDHVLPPLGTYVIVAWSRGQNFFYLALF